MRQTWSEFNKRLIWRKIWVALAETQMEFGLVSEAQLDDLKEHAEEIDIPASREIESEIQHDLMAEIKTFAGQSKIGGSILHLGATSMDIEDNADVIRIQRSIYLILDNLRNLLITLCKKMESFADLPIMAFTHLQPAEPSTLGYRFALYAQDLFADFLALESFVHELKGKGFKGAVGSRASYAELIGRDQLDGFESKLSTKLKINFYTISSQTYPRRQDFIILILLAAVAASLNKMAFDFRILQMPQIGELNEPFTNSQVGSSAMPFKRNPIKLEKINSLARYLSQLPHIAWDNAANSLLERTLDDSANRRIILPEAFLCLDEILLISIEIINNMTINLDSIKKNLTTYSSFSGTERVLLAAVKAGANRQSMHELLRKHCMIAWKSIQDGKSNPLVELICEDPGITRYIDNEKIQNLLSAQNHIGDCPERTGRLVRTIREHISG